MKHTIQIFSLVIMVLCTLGLGINDLAAQQQSGARQVRGARDAYGSEVAEDVTFTFDEETGSLIVITDDDTNEHIKTIIEKLDKPVPQVLINVLFLEITHSDELDVGVEGEIRYGSEGTQDIIETIFGLANQTYGGFYRILDDNVDITIRAIAEVAKLELLSRPSILTRNNEEAIITIGQEVPFIRNSRVTSDGQIINTVEYEDIGIILQVTPHITPDKLVELEVMPEISTLTGESVTVSAGVESPVIAKRSAETRVVVPDGRTVVIGGLIQDQLVEAVRKVPILGDIPLLGIAFRRTVTTKSKTELLIFLTPYVLEKPSDVAQITNKERKSLELTPDVFTDKQMHRYFEDYEEYQDYEEEFE
jgi:general secretion pathway protein D